MVRLAGSARARPEPWHGSGHGHGWRATRSACRQPPSVPARGRCLRPRVPAARHPQSPVRSGHGTRGAGGGVPGGRTVPVAVHGGRPGAAQPRARGCSGTRREAATAQPPRCQHRGGAACGRPLRPRLCASAWRAELPCLSAAGCWRVRPAARTAAELAAPAAQASASPWACPWGGGARAGRGREPRRYGQLGVPAAARGAVAGCSATARR